MQALQSLLASDVAFYADGGGKRSAAPQPIKASQLIRYGFVNGLPGFVTLESDNELQDDGAADRGRQDRRDLCHAQSRVESGFASSWAIERVGGVFTGCLQSQLRVAT